MNKKSGLYIIAVSIVVLTLTLLGETCAKRSKWLPINKEVTLDEIEKTDSIGVLVPAAENKGLTNDVKGTMFENDSTIYLILPEDVDERKIAYYLYDQTGANLLRMESDFSEGKVCAAKKDIKVVKSALPVMFIYVNDENSSFEQMKESGDKELLCYGDMYLSVPKKLAAEKGWATETISKEADYNTPRTASLNLRGNSTKNDFIKKPFTLGLEKSQSLLEMGKNKKWNLLANARDKTILKNYIFLELARNINMEFVPKSQNITVYVDGEYQGVYLLTTKVSVDKNRINLSDGDFLLNWGGPDQEQTFFYESDSWYLEGVPDAPAWCELEWPENDAKIDEKQAIMQNLIWSIEDESSSDFINYLDLESAAKYYWIQEASMNADATCRSTYSYYKADTNKMYMGPVWDMDATLGLDTTQQGVSLAEPEGWKIRYLSWYAALFAHEEFREEVKRVYYEDGIREELFAVIAQLEEEKEHLSIDGELNYRRWASETEAYGLQYDVDSYEELTDCVIDFYTRRINWIDEQMKKE